MEKEKLNESKNDSVAPKAQDAQQVSSPPAAVGGTVAASSTPKKKRNRRRNNSKKKNAPQGTQPAASAKQAIVEREEAGEATDAIQTDTNSAQEDALVCVAQAKDADAFDMPVLESISQEKSQEKPAENISEATPSIEQDAQASTKDEAVATENKPQEAASAKDFSWEAAEDASQDAINEEQAQDATAEKDANGADTQTSAAALLGVAALEDVASKTAKKRRRRKSKQTQNASVASETSVQQEVSATEQDHNTDSIKTSEPQETDESILSEEIVAVDAKDTQTQPHLPDAEPFEADAQEAESIITLPLEEVDDSIDLRGAFESETAQEEIRAELEQEGFDAQADEFIDLEDEIEAEKKKKPFSIYRFFVAATAIFAFMSALFVLMLFILSDSPLIRPKEDVDLPVFSGKNLESIQNDAQYFKFSFEVNEIYQKGVAAGIIVDQWPKPPKKVKENARIILRVSSGKNRIPIPAVAGMGRLEAKNLFRSNDLSMMVMPEYSENVVEDTVLRTEPAEGSVVDAGSMITVYVSKGEEGENTTIVPGCVGLSLTQANQILSERRLTAGSVSRVNSDSAAGTVIGQSPKAGTGSTHGSVVNLTVSKGPETAAPSVAVGTGGHAHSYVQTAQAAPGPDYIGFTTHTCTVCGDVYYDNVQQATG